MSDVKYQEIEVELVGQDGNAFMILCRVRKALRRAGVSKDERDAFTKEATSGDYDNLLVVVCRWVTVN